MFANCTHIIGSLLKVWMVTVLWMECEDAAINISIHLMVILSHGVFSKLIPYACLQWSSKNGHYFKLHVWEIYTNEKNGSAGRFLLNRSHIELQHTYI